MWGLLLETMLHKCGALDGAILPAAQGSEAVTECHMGTFPKTVLGDGRPT